MDKKVIITGTGRCGTTFLMLIYSYLEQGTGYDTNAESELNENCNAGLESRALENVRIHKSPHYFTNLGEVLCPHNNPTFIEDNNIGTIIVPVRNFIHAARSREFVGVGVNGGIYAGTNVDDQMSHDLRSMSNFLEGYLTHELPVCFLSFDKMISDPEYLFNKIKHTFIGDVTYESFLEAYNKADKQQKEGKIRRGVSS